MIETRLVALLQLVAGESQLDITTEPLLGDTKGTFKPGVGFLSQYTYL